MERVFLFIDDDDRDHVGKKNSDKSVDEKLEDRRPVDHNDFDPELDASARLDRQRSVYA